jgi:hypothetical protein
MKKEIFSKNCNHDIFKFIEQCKILRKKYGEKVFEVEESKQEFIKFSEKILNSFEKVECLNKKNRPYVFFNIFVTSYLKYIDGKIIREINDNPDNNRALVTLLFSAIKKHEIIVNLLECEEYENGLILFRSFYENMIILQFLQDHKECISDFEKYSAYKLSKLSKKSFAQIIEKNEYQSIKYQFDTNKMNKDYGWADQVFKEEKITFSSIVEKVFENDHELMNKMRDMYKVVSDLVHSNTCALNDNLFKDLLYIKILGYLSTFGIPMIKNNFYILFKNMFDNIFSFEMEIFKEIFEYIIMVKDGEGSKA